MPRLPIALTSGEPAGVGPEIAAKAWAALKDSEIFFLIGDPTHLPAGTPVVEILAPEAAADAIGEGLPVLTRDFGAPRVPGTAQTGHAPHVVAAIREAVELVRAGRAAAVCTNPIHKKALQDGAGFAFPGHTEFLAHLAGVDDVVMMLACDALRVVPATIHIALADVATALTRNRLETCIRITDAGLRAQGLARPRIAVAGLNPHAGEGGAMGRDEIEMIGPLLDELARRRARDRRAAARPTRCSTPQARARYDVAICMYHDQALIPIKTLDFDHGVNVTLGLRFRAHLARPRHRLRHRRHRHRGPLVADRRLADGAGDGRVSAIDGLPPLRDVIAAHGLRAKKSLGQNFLLDLNLTARIARAAGDLSSADVLEVGPGPGGLTRGLLAEGARHVLAVEKDTRAMAALAEIAAFYPGRLEVVNADALEIDVQARLTPPIKVVANLPYNVGTELLVRWLTPAHWPPFWESLTLMFQKEVAARIVAKPGSKAYGRLAILAQWRTDPRLVMELPPEAFTPPPKIHSAVVHFVALQAPRYPAPAEGLQRLTATAFQQRRKMLRASLKGLHPEISDLLESVGIPPTARAEEIDVERFCALARALD